MKTFVWNNGRPEAMRSYNDDLIMACAIGCWVRDTALIENKRNIEYNKAFLATMEAAKTKMNTTIKGMHGYEGDSVFEKKKKHSHIVKLFDIADDLHWKSRKNYTLQHAAERIKIYSKEHFDYKLFDINI